MHFVENVADFYAIRYFFARIFHRLFHFSSRDNLLLLTILDSLKLSPTRLLSFN